jgi:exodeoxyribonuclease-3
MALHAKCEHLAELRPDIAVVPECAEPDIIRKKASRFHFDDCEWAGQGEHKGLGVFAFNGHSLRRHASWDPRYHLFLPIEVCGPTSFNLLAVWAFNHRVPVAVIPNPRTTREAVNHYATFLSGGDGVVAGDFNASVVWDRDDGAGSFNALDASLSDLGLVSAYHAHRSVPLGHEPEKTHFWQRNPKQLFHIDYAYIPKRWTSGLREVTVGDVATWITRSDHAPVIVDVTVPMNTSTADAGLQATR